MTLKKEIDRQEKYQTSFQIKNFPDLNINMMKEIHLI